MNTITAMPSTEAEREAPPWLARIAFPVLTGCMILVQILLGFAVFHGWTWLAVLLVFPVAHLMHGQLIALHEASHSLLRKNRWLNDIDGFLIGAFGFMSFTLYRAAHQTHHMHLSSERDEELWPFVVTGTPRWQRVLAAVLELTVGILFTPFLFLRTFLRKNSPIRAPRIRRRIWIEFALIGLLWAAVLAVVAMFDLWRFLVWMYVVPAVIAGNLQSWRKYIEHVGMTGNTPNSATRSIICRDWLGKVLSFSLLHEPYHGVHHRFSGLPHAELPLHEDALQPEADDDVPPFPSYRHALGHLLSSLGDPKVGGQWRRA